MLEMTRAVSLAFLVGLCLCACGDDGSDQQGGPVDAGQTDTPDADVQPTEATDAGDTDPTESDVEPDGAVTDTETEPEETEIEETEASDDTLLDGGLEAGLPSVPDAGAERDAAIAPEAGSETPNNLVQQVVDLAQLAGVDGFRRVYGTPEGDGTLGVPVAGSWDLDADGEVDFAMASFQASPLMRSGAGQIYVLFGDGRVSGDIDLAEQRDDVLMIYGDSNFEGAGSELWMDDVTGDGVGDLLISRQNHRASDPDRIGAGALSIVVGGPHLRARLESGEPIDLRSPPDDIPIVTLVGPEELGRFGIWVRSGDVSGDGIADIVIGADQESIVGETFRGASYLLRGGEHLSASLVVDLIDFGVTPLAGHLAKMTPPAGESTRYHFGATVTIADLDRNGRAEVLSSAALVRSGASYRAEDAPAGSAEAQGGAPGGRVYIAWDDNFAGDVWPAGYSFDVSEPPGTVTTLLPGTVDDLANRQMGEELIGGQDYDGDGRHDLFVGDMTGISGSGRGNGGIGVVIYEAGRLRDLATFTPLQPEEGFDVTVLKGPTAGAITSDTVHHGDFDADGIVDLAVAAPNASPDGRVQAGTVYVLWGNKTRWPAMVDLGNLPSSAEIQVTELWGVLGADGSDGGDMLAYSADTSDIDGDGLVDLIMNEMGGNGTSTAAIDSGNFLVLSGALLSATRPDCAGYVGGGAKFDACGRCSGGQSGLDETLDCVQFRRDVQPLLLGECSQCHGNSGGLSVFSYDLLMQGTSDHGPVIIPGDPENSALLYKIFRQPPFGDPMPPDYELQPEQIDVIQGWIAEGALDN